jgi:hypothetical protein
MINYRTYKVDIASSGSTALGEGSTYPRVWGIMKGEFNVSGSLTLEGGGVINLVSLDNHQIFPCYPKLLTITTGSLYMLS